MKKYPNHMIRTDFDGKSHNGDFEWKPLGRWTVAPDWNGKPECGGGLHGQGTAGGISGYGYTQRGSRLVFCEVDPSAGVVSVNGDKIKCKRAKIVAVDDAALQMIAKHYPDGFPGSFDLSGCKKIKALPAGLGVGGSLYMHGCTGITVLLDDLKVGDSLNLYGRIELTALPAGLKVGDSLNLSGCPRPPGLTFSGEIWRD